MRQAARPANSVNVVFNLRLPKRKRMKGAITSLHQKMQEIELTAPNRNTCPVLLLMEKSFSLQEDFVVTTKIFFLLNGMVRTG